MTIIDTRTGHDPFRQDYFVACLAYGMATAYEIRQSLLPNTDFSVWLVYTDTSVLKADGLTWMQAMRWLAEKVESEIAPEEGRPIEVL